MPVSYCIVYCEFVTLVLISGCRFEVGHVFQIDMADIADAYEDVRGESLERAIKADCSGDYMKMLVSLARRK